MQQVLDEEEGSALNRIDCNEVIDDTADDDQRGDDVACTRQNGSQLVQLLVEWRLHLLFLLDPLLSLALLGIGAYGRDFVVTGALEDDRSPEQEIRVIRLVTLQSGSAAGRLVGVRLAGVGGLVDPDHLPEDDSSISGDIVAAFELHQIADNNIAFPDGHNPGFRPLPRAADNLDVLLVPHLLADIELPVGLHFERERDAGREEDGQEDADGLEK